MARTIVYALKHWDDAVASLNRFHAVCIRRGYPGSEFRGVPRPRKVSVLQRVSEARTLREKRRLWGMVHEEINLINPIVFYSFLFDREEGESYEMAQADFEAAYYDVRKYF